MASPTEYLADSATLADAHRVNLYVQIDGRRGVFPEHIFLRIISNSDKELWKEFSWRGAGPSKPPRFLQVINRIWYHSRPGSVAQERCGLEVKRPSHLPYDFQRIS
jgi:hypothetical protein